MRRASLRGPIMFKPVVVIPVYNHPQTITAVVKQVLAQHVPCILVNDGSDVVCTQTLRALAQQCPQQITLVEHEINQGKGAAVSTGLRIAYAADYTHALQVDADGQHELADISRFLAIAQAYPEVIVCGYPVYDASVPKGRLYGRYLTHIWVWINTLSLRIKDSMCGFRVYPLSRMMPLLSGQTRSRRMGWDTEILVRADWAGIPIVNTATRVHYPKDGISHFQGVRDNVLISRMHASLFFGMLIRSPRLALRSLTDKPRYE